MRPRAPGTPAAPCAPVPGARHGRWAVVLAALLLGTPPATAADAVPAGEQQLDTGRSRAGFQLRTRWGQRIDGELPLLGGGRRVLADGRHQVRVVLDATRVQVEDSGRLGAIARGERFFDAADHPRIVFLSDPYPPALLHDGGSVPGWLQVRGVRRPEVFVLEPGACVAPASQCPVHAHGSIDRGDYGMDSLRLALTDRVQFDLSLWLREPPTGVRDPGASLSPEPLP